LVSGEAIQNRGFEIVAGIVDSLWGKLPNEGKIDASIIKDICQEIEEKTDLPIDHEGTFKWIVFLPRRHEPEVGVLNRYYGCFEDGSFKVRGIELRRRDTCEFIKSAQAEALEVLASATNKEEFYELLIGKYWDVHEKYDTMLRNREVPVEQLFIKKVIAKEPSQYAMAVHQAIAAQQLARSGVHLQSGMKVSYLVTDSTAKSTNKRVIASVLYKGQKPYDLKWYQKMLKEAFDNIIPPSFTPEHPTSLKLERFTSLMNIN
jgi:DNA polymerase-2